MSLLLSICVLTYNRESTLRETLDSLLPQVADRNDVEIYVSDDASPDNTEALVRSYCERHPQLRYNRLSRNTKFDGNVVSCCENAAGEYLAFFSDDDLAPADYVARLIADIEEFRPEVIYLNHAGFHQNNPALLDSPTQPVLKRLFTDPTEYFLYTGLGFISALVFKTAEARKHIPKVVLGRGTGFVDISGRCVLTTKGPYLFDGTIIIPARYDLNHRENVLTWGPIAYTGCLRDLQRDGLLGQGAIAWHKRKTIKLFLPRCIVNNRLNFKVTVPASQLRELYGDEPSFYLIAYPLALIPPRLLRWIFLPIRAIMRVRRTRRIRSGKRKQISNHIAPDATALH